MPMVNSKEMFKKAYEGGYAIGAFNVNNMEIIQGITEGAKMENAPLILQVSAGARKYAKHVYLMKMIEAAIEDTDLPIVVHLDHGPDFETCKSCIDGGFTSVMIDGSHLPFEENIALTRKVVEYAHDRNVTVEAELGRLAGVEDDVKVSAEDSSYTRPEEVEEFATRTGCDSLAISLSMTLNGLIFTLAVEEPEPYKRRLEELNEALADSEDRDVRDQALHLLIGRHMEREEYGRAEDIFLGKQHHPYTEGLFGSLPELNATAKRLSPINGLMPDPMALPEGCKFHPRCPHCTERCKKEIPAVHQDGEHMIRCHLMDKEVR